MLSNIDIRIVDVLGAVIFHHKAKADVEGIVVLHPWHVPVREVSKHVEVLYKSSVCDLVGLG